MVENTIHKEPLLDDAALAEAVQACVNTWHDNTLKQCCRDFKLCDEGSLARAKSPYLKNMVRAKILALVKQEDATSDFAKITKFYSGEIRFLQSLSLSLLQEYYVPLISLFGKATLCLSGLLSEEVERRTWAKELTKQTLCEILPEDAAKTRLSPIFHVLLQKLGNAPMGSTRAQEKIATLERALEEAGKKLTRDVRALRDEHAKENREWKDVKNTLTFSIEELKRQLEIAQREVEKERALQERHAHELLAAKQVALFGEWLKPHLEREAIAQQSIEDVLAYADEAIQYQSRYDRASENAQRLQQQVEALEEKLCQVNRVLCMANAKSPQILRAKAELEKELDRLRRQLPTCTYSPLAQAMMEKLNAATDAELPAILTWMESTEKLNLLSKAEVREIRTLYARRVSIWDTTAPTVEDDSIFDAEELAIEKRNAELCAALRGHAPMLLFLDGHNILNGLGRYRQRRGQARTHEANRKLLEKDLSLLLRNLPETFAHLVWDGATMSVTDIAENIQRHYSGGGNAEHRADNYILDQLKYYSEHTDIPLVLVTDDNDFGGAARRMGAKVCRLHDFEAFLNFPHHD